MTRTHTSFEVSKRLKEFCPELPEPMDLSVSTPWGVKKCDKITAGDYGYIWAYQLHDLLSKPFCEALAEKIGKGYALRYATEIFGAYYRGGLPAVEAELIRMMEGK